jgi:nucleotide-binding universal stress UspA family protein
MYKKILVPLDGSERAEAILSHVESIAKCYTAEVILLQVLEPHVLYASPYDAYPELNLADVEHREPEAEIYLAQLEERFRSQDIDVDHRIERGPVVSAILEAAAEEDADLIAMVSHGRTGLARVFYGSVAAGVLNRIDRPLLLVRSQ